MITLPHIAFEITDRYNPDFKYKHNIINYEYP
jgi:hypothetical protein